METIEKKEKIPEYPRSKVSMIQEAQNEIEYWKALITARDFTIDRMTQDRVAAKAALKRWEGRLAKLTGRKEAFNE